MAFSSGTFSLVAGNPVVTGTTISSTWANDTLSDIATNGLTMCVLKDGTQTVTANMPFAGFFLTNAGVRAPNGTVGAPSIAFINDTGCGYYRIGASNIGFAIGGVKVREIGTGGEFTSPLQPAFLATPSGALLNVTGDGTLYDVVFATEIFDQGTDYATTGVFTAPVAGRYQFNAAVNFSSLAAGHTELQMYLVTSNRSHYLFIGNAFAIQAGSGTNSVLLSGSALADMDAADTAVVRVVASGSTKVVDIDVTSEFSGFLFG